MAWTKRGLVEAPRPELAWSQSYCIVPTPDLRVDGILRVYYASTDRDNIGRIGWVDLDPRDPARVLRRAARPVLEEGEPGAFDDCGVNPSCVLDWKGRKLLYYIGYQRAERVPYLLFAGLAASTDGGETFARVQRVPILERTDDELTIRSAPSVLADGDRLRMWYVSARGWRTLEGGKQIPLYGIRSAESEDGVRWRGVERPCVEPLEDEVGLGRPWVVREGAMFRMWYSRRRQVGPNALGYTGLGTAVSMDGYSWTRDDDSVGIARSETGWDSEMICYAAIVATAHGRIMLYNGNGNGRTGFGVAVRDGE